MIQIKSFSFNPFSENTYVVYNEKGNAFLIDPGNWIKEETQVLQKFIEENKLVINTILLTHAHIDHTLGLQTVYDLYQVPVVLHPIEQEILDRNSLDAKRFGFSFVPFLGKIEYVNEDDVLFLDNDVLKVIHLPGHSPGSVGYYNENQNFIISGDVLFQGSIGRTDLYKGDTVELLSNIKNKLFTLPEKTMVFPGHGGCTTIEKEKKSNPFFI